MGMGAIATGSLLELWGAVPNLPTPFADSDDVSTVFAFVVFGS